MPQAARVGILRPTARLLDDLAHLAAGAQLLAYPARLGPLLLLPLRGLEVFLRERVA
jgi:hypothetical protein